MIGAVIFDFDGVITDSEILHLRSFNRVLEPFGVKIDKDDYYTNYLGLSDLDFFTILAEKNQHQLKKEQIKNLLEKKKQIYEHLAATEGAIIPGVRSLLEMLKKNSVPMAICSGALRPEIELILEQAKLRNFFKAIVSAEQVKKGKPDPQGFLMALSKLNENAKTPILPHQCVVIEDSHWGLKAALAAGMHTVAITNSYSADLLTPAEKIVDHISRLNMDELTRICR